VGHSTCQQRLDAMIALKFAPPSLEREEWGFPGILQDGYGIYDETLNGQLRQVAQKLDQSNWLR